MWIVVTGLVPIYVEIGDLNSNHKTYFVAISLLPI
jgi:hypothetical protein